MWTLLEGAYIYDDPRYIELFLGWDKCWRVLVELKVVLPPSEGVQRVTLESVGTAELHGLTAVHYSGQLDPGNLQAMDPGSC